MKIVRFQLAAGRAGFGDLQSDGSARVLAGDFQTGFAPTEELVRDFKLLAPVQPTNIIGIGMNYRKHAEEGGREVPTRPMWFMKTTNAIQHPGEPIVIPGGAAASHEVDYEAELAVVLARPCRDATKANALSFVLGYTCANDVSARDWQFKWGGGQFNQGKSFDTFCPLGPVLVTPDEIPDPNALRIRSILDGETMQDWSTSDMVFDVPTLIEFLSAGRTLPADTVILTGTPHGVGFARKPPRFLRPGDTISIEIEKIGTLTNPVIAAS
ncbi:fumarylacetoacetate hydrolase family protein [Opitutales bacterium ASA1]|uniref:fumarylacetoacetate hydrolase family protein n=1 Tax=Congregicoccus parvus TaxID=3081749 RepID=UPI002B2D3411|nr:fumarylacetoacetate hydrolase family protein [Opitutales bacterium ASA1]